MTISTQQSIETFLGNGVTSVFNFTFVADAAADIEAIYTDSSGTQTVLTSSQYTLSINAPAAGQLWGVGGSVTYPTSGSPISSGTSLTVQRIIPLQQLVTISNQGDFAPQVIEQALDVLELQIQQIAARTGQYRGTWASGIVYNFGDIVVDGTNGTNTTNYYMCIIANTSGTWSTDLAAGDWIIFINNATAITGPTGVAGGVLTGNYPNPTFAPFAANTILGNNTSSSAAPIKMTVAQTQALLKLDSWAITDFSGSGTFTTPSDSSATTIYEYESCGAGGGGGGANGVDAIGGGGGAGEFATGTFTGVAASTGITITIGAAGAAGTSAGTNGGTGGTTTIGSPVSITCVGGTGGGGSTSGASTVTAGGAGGTGGTGSPTRRVAGGQGGNGTFLAGQFGIGGYGANSRFGNGGVGFVAAGAGTLGPTAAIGFGSGGAGAGGATQAGTAGTAGYVIIRRVTP